MGRRVAGSVVIWVITLACLAPTALIWHSSVTDARDVQRDRLDLFAATAENLIGDQLVRFVDLLRAVDGQLSASVFVEQSEYTLFVEKLRLAESYPGAESVVVIERTAAGPVVTYTAPAEEADNPVGARVDAGSPLSALAAALDVARSTNQPVATPLLRGGDRAGALEFYVVRATPGTDRWVGVRVEAQRFLDALTPRLPGAEVTVTDVSPDETAGDGPPSAVDRIVPNAAFASTSAAGTHGTASVEISLLGRQWLIEVAPVHDVLSPSERRQPAIVLGAGLLASAAIIGFAVYQSRARRRAVALADRASRSEALHRRLLEAAPVAIVELDPNGRVQTWNAAASELFGAPAAAMIGSTWTLPVRDREVALDRTGAMDDLDGTRMVVDTPNGDRHVVAFTTTALDVDERRLLILVDETDRQRLEAQLIQAQKLEVFGRLAGGIAHDFNNFLTAVTGYIDIVLMRDRIEPADRSALLESHRAAERAAAVVAQLLTISRRQVTVPEVVDVAKLLDGLSSLLHTVVGNHAQLRLHLVPASRPATVRIDRTHLEQIILNLVVNAGEAMVDAGQIDIWVEQRDERVVLRVVDDGPGMDESTAEQVFEPFFTTKAGTGGTGLGLSTVYSIVTSAGGTITITSEPGRGAAFEVQLPRAQADEPAVSATTAVEPESQHDVTILLVEDDPSVRRLTTAVLQQHGYHVISAGDADEATSLFLEHRADIGLLLSDVVLRGRSGPQLAAELQRQRPDLPVLFMSGYAEGALSEHGRLPAGTRFLGKPFRSDDLIRQVRGAIRDAR